MYITIIIFIIKINFLFVKIKEFSDSNINKKYLYTFVMFYFIK